MTATAPARKTRSPPTNALATTSGGRILLDAKAVSKGETVLIRLSRGRLRTTVTDREEET